MQNNFFEILGIESQIIATSIHSGHKILNKKLEQYFNINEFERLKEEDPYTDLLTDVCESRIIVHNSRFEVDLNRPREKAVYLIPEDAWGLMVWKEKILEEVIEESLKLYDEFYKSIKEYFSNIEMKFGKFVVLDIHSYNYKRSSHYDPQSNPDINLGTGTMNREKWAFIIDKFTSNLKSFKYDKFENTLLDIRENIKFKGGYFPKWIHTNFPNSACCISIEFKKIFMDENTGELYDDKLYCLLNALKYSIDDLIDELNKSKFYDFKVGSK